MTKKKLTKRERDAKAFEASLTPENKKMFEEILSSVDETSCFSARLAVLSLISIIGERPTIFILDLFDQANPMNIVSNIKGISDETRKYLYSLCASQELRLWGVLSQEKFAHPKQWISVGHISTTYDGDDFFIKYQILNGDREKLTIENSINDQVLMMSIMLDMLVTQTTEIRKIQKNLGVEKKTLSNLKRMMKKFDQMISGAKS